MTTWVERGLAAALEHPPEAVPTAPHQAELTTSDGYDVGASEIPPDQESFALFEVRAVYVYARYSDLEDGTYVQRTAFHTPDGGLYAQMARAFSVGPEGPATIIASGIGELAVQPATVSPGGPFVVTPLFVSGTPIMLNVVAGTWRVVVTLDGQAEPAGQTSFDLVK
ncbi:MAG: hypothetical protein HY906_08060 [Deltaproteobacteria bacterium]|nr:hypothetical protein [Deltaproteobacteria bacterium]